MRLKSTHIQYAASRRNASKLRSLPRGISFEDAWDMSWEEVERRRLKVSRRRKGRSALVYADTMYLPPKFWTTDLPYRVAWLRHELVHDVQQDADGNAKFARRWGLDQRWRWAYETQSDVERVVTLQRIGMTKRSLRAYIKKRAKANASATGVYKLWRVPRSQAEREAEKIFLRAVGL